jgi:hypothetical protein
MTKHGPLRLSDMMARMLRILTLAAGAALAAAQTPQSIYVLPMSGGFDQQIASRLASSGVFQVVADPQQAEAVLTDHIGPRFEERLDELYSPPKEPLKAGEAESRPRFGGASRGRGNLFLVDRKTRRVVWSAFEPPRSTLAADLDRAARRVAGRLARDLYGRDLKDR